MGVQSALKNSFRNPTRNNPQPVCYLFPQPKLGLALVYCLLPVFQSNPNPFFLNNLRQASTTWESYNIPLFFSISPKAASIPKAGR